MHRHLGMAVAFAALTVAAPAAATDLDFPVRGRAAVVDAAHVLTVGQAAALNERIAAWDRATGHQFVVATVPSLQGLSIAEYGYQLGRAWGLGRKGINDGAILLLAPHERKVRIEVGRGLEGDLTDAQSSVILSGVVVPRLKAGNMADALTIGADAIMSAVPASAGDVANAPTPPKHSIWWALGILGTLWAVAIGTIIMFSRAARRRRNEREESLRHEAEREQRDKAALSAARDRWAGIASSGSGSAPYHYRSAANRSAPTAQVIAPVVITNSPSRTDERAPSRVESPPSRSDDSGSSSWPSFDSGSPSSSDSGSSGGFDSGGGDFGGGGSDSSW